MKTKFFPKEFLTNEQILEASALLKEGKLVIFPTETVYGLGASIDCPQAIEKIFVLKRRPQNKSLIIHISSLERVFSFGEDFSEAFFLLTKAFFPGPLTLVVKKKASTNFSFSHDGTIAFRMPKNDIALKLIEGAGGAIVATSVNFSGEPSITTAEEAFAKFSSKVAAVLDGGRATLEIPSTVLNLTTTPLQILRKGTISKEQIERVLGKKIIENSD